MDQEKAVIIAAALDGEASNSGGGDWLVLLKKNDGRLVVMSDEMVCEYQSDDEFEVGSPGAVIRFV